MTARKPPAGAPWAPTPWEPADVGAIQALAAGEATPEQQKRALTWIVERACDTYGMSYRPDSDRDTTFAEGKRYVGLQVVKMTKLNLAAIKQAKKSQ